MPIFLPSPGKGQASSQELASFPRIGVFSVKLRVLTPSIITTDDGDRLLGVSKPFPDAVKHVVLRPVLRSYRLHKGYLILSCSETLSASLKTQSLLMTFSGRAKRMRPKEEQRISVLFDNACVMAAILPNC